MRVPEAVCTEDWKALAPDRSADVMVSATPDPAEIEVPQVNPPHAGAANVPSPRRKVVVLLGGVGTPPPTVAVIVATLPVAIGVENVCTPVKVFAASVLAIVAEVEGNVMVVASVPARVRELEADNTFSSVMFNQMYIADQEAPVVPDVRIHVTKQRVHGHSIRIVLAPELCIITSPVELFRM